MNQIQLFGITHNLNPYLNFHIHLLYNINNKKIYQCPKCKFVSGTLTPIYPNKPSVFIHTVDCHNTKSIPIEFNFDKV